MLGGEKLDRSRISRGWKSSRKGVDGSISTDTQGKRWLRGDLVTKDMEKILDVIFILVFTGETGSPQPQVLETSGKGPSEEDLPWWGGRRIWSTWTGCLRSLDLVGCTRGG